MSASANAIAMELSPAVALPLRLPRRLPLWLLICWHMLLGAIVLLVLCKAWTLGQQLRRYAWDQGAPIHFAEDISNGMERGARASRYGIANMYELYQAIHEDGMYGFDYAPARLWVMTRWVEGLRAKEPQRTGWSPDYVTNEPLLSLNGYVEAMAALGAGALVWLWSRRSYARRGWFKTPWLSAWHGSGRALLAALLFWFSPAVIFAAHIWPQWDVWLVPFFLWALFMASIDAWLAAGVLVAVGAMFKGQILFVAPLFVLWPLFAGRPTAALRWLIGLALGVAVAVWPWMLTRMVVPAGGLYQFPDRAPQRLWSEPSVLWVICAICAAVVAPLVFRAGRLFAFGLYRSERLAIARWVCRLLGIALAVGLLAWPFLSGPNRALLPVALGLSVVFCLLLPGMTWRCHGYLIAAAAGISLLLCIPFFGASTAWAKIGFGYGTRHFLVLARPEVNNLPALMAERWNWTLDDAVNFASLDTHMGSLHLAASPTIKQVLSVVDFVLLMVCGAAAAVQSHRRSGRLLVAFVAAWVILFAILPQMHQRYLLWGGCISVLLVSQNFGLALLYLPLAALAWMQIAHTLFKQNPGFARDWVIMFDGLHPGIAWMLLLIAAILIYAAVKPGRRRLDER